MVAEGGGADEVADTVGVEGGCALAALNAREGAAAAFGHLVAVAFEVVAFTVPRAVGVTAAGFVAASGGLVGWDVVVC